MPDYTLVMGNKNYSSWSMRPWLVLRHFEIPFTEHVIALFEPGHDAAIRAVSPSGKVPLLVDGDLRVWDSLAICDYLAERHAGLWPQDPAARAIARAVSAEMHSGFMALRSAFTCNIRRRTPTSTASPSCGRIAARVLAKTARIFLARSRSPMRCTRPCAFVSRPTAWTFPVPRASIWRRCWRPQRCRT